MAVIYQPTLFSWKDSLEVGDLERFKMVMESLPDEELISSLETERKKGRNDYPVRPVWNSIIAKFIYQHPSINSLIRELHRNAQLREVCGFDPLKGVSVVPTKDAYSRFILKLEKYQLEIDKIFHSLVAMIKEKLPDFGANIAIDSEALSSLTRGTGKYNSERDERAECNDRRKDNDADWGKKYVFADKDGEKKRVGKTWFGFKLHILADSKYELPIAYNVTRASTHDGPEAYSLIDDLRRNNPDIIARCNYFTADRAYDDIKLHTYLWKDCQIKGVIDSRNMWKGDKKRQLEMFPSIDNVTYNEKGELFCSCPKTAQKLKMPLGGFEHNRDSIKFKCPAAHYDFHCKGSKSCPVATGIRVPLKENQRIFTPVPRNSRNWKQLYKRRTSVERVFSRLDTSYGFDFPKIRGKARFRLNGSLALTVMLAMAKGRLERGQDVDLRSLVKAA